MNANSNQTPRDWSKIWSVFGSSADNVVKPWLISQGSDLPFILIFFGVLGGAPEFGF